MTLEIQALANDSHTNPLPLDNSISSTTMSIKKICTDSLLCIKVNCSYIQSKEIKSTKEFFGWIRMFMRVIVYCITFAF